MVRTPILIIVTLFCISCSSQIDTHHDTVPVESNKQLPKETINCSAPAQVQNRSKIEARLVKKGTITSDMSAEERKKIVSDYINRKTKPYKDCLK